MKTIRLTTLFLILLISTAIYGQRKELKGQLLADDEVEGIHILNKTASKYAISDEKGQFTILAKASDTLFISGLKYQIKEVEITENMIVLGQFSVQLVEKINQLDEVIVGTILTGSLESDLENSDTEPEVNFYDLGIPGFVGKPLTQNERKLHDADVGPMGYIGLGGGVNLHKLLNRISGRTKKLKAIVDLDNKEKCITRLRRNYEETIFKQDSLATPLRNEYFLYCQEDVEFKALCEENNDLKAIEFLQSKLIAYKNNLESKDEN